MANHGRFLTIPLAVIGSVAMAVGAAAPAQAATIKRHEHAGSHTDSIGMQPTVSAAGPRAAFASTASSTASSAASSPAGAAAALSTAGIVAASLPAPHTYTVANGDTVSAVAARYGLATARVLALNGLSWKSLIFPGQVLTLTDAAPAPVAAPTRAPAPSPTSATYTVVRGDTVSGIAAAHGVSTASVLAANGLNSSSIIYPGQSLAIPGGAASAPAAQAPAPTPAPARAAEAFTPQRAASVTAFTAEMRQNAQTIIAVGRQLGVPDDGIVVALAAAMQESGLRNLGYGDEDSLGLFQQRPSTGWGTAAQILDPVRSTRAFFGGPSNPNAGLTRGLLDIAGWQSMPVTVAAQSVQISAYPEAYAKWESDARAWLAALG
ncbi:LysM peptidoglycan-binding domain-containing protein [Microbacterium sp. STN6]|uniref:lytic transglycosylase n=1 Tax=Microbacterium sp. STN6 TaxID=2995588 RepID=UPI002260A109|nr:LysM peptidoglycan-binding domain-containing protein [Microbacterium sp. STN6]MCX7521498.1 LysM peptidoglycan-binding domain-containing protein [Microbacterium sp. STN6]